MFCGHFAARLFAAAVIALMSVPIWAPANAQIPDSIRSKTIPLPKAPLPQPRVELPDKFIEISADYYLCNVMQIHLARRNFWDDLYLGYGVQPDALDNYVADMSSATRELCNGDADSAEFQRALAGVESFRADVDERNASLFGASIESAYRYRLAGLGEIDRWIDQNCFSESDEFLALPFARFPMTPDIGLSSPALPASAAIGNCSGGATPGAGGATGIDAGTVGAGLVGVSQCLANYRTQATSCDNPAGVDSERAEELIEEIETSCANNGNCNRTYNEKDDGSRDVSIEHTREFSDGRQATVSVSYNRDAEGNLTSFTMQQVVTTPNGFTETASLRLTDVEEAGIGAEKIKIIPSAPPPSITFSPQLIRDLVRYEVTRRAIGWIPGIDMPRIPIPGGRLQCESFAAAGKPTVSFASSAPAGGGRRVGLGNLILSPDDAIAECLCDGGRYGKQLANNMGFSCGGRSPDTRKRLFCMRAGGGTTISDLCTNLAEQDNGAGADLSSMCSAVMQCPPDSLLDSGVIDGRLRCGCGLSSPPRGQRDQCSRVACPGPGFALSESEAVCCRAPSFRTLTPRMQLQRAIDLQQRIRSFETPLPTGLSVPVAEDIAPQVEAPIQSPRPN